ATFDSPLGKWLYVKATLATLIVLVYGTFLYVSRKKPQYLQEDPRIMFWCLATQLLGLILVIAVTTIGTMLVYYPHALERLGGWPGDVGPQEGRPGRDPWRGLCRVVRGPDGEKGRVRAGRRHADRPAELFHVYAAAARGGGRDAGPGPCEL